MPSHTTRRLVHRRVVVIRHLRETTLPISIPVIVVVWVLALIVKMILDYRVRRLTASNQEYQALKEEMGGMRRQLDTRFADLTLTVDARVAPRPEVPRFRLTARSLVVQGRQAYRAQLSRQSSTASVGA